MTVYRFQQRRGSTTQWSTANTILAAGEIGFESDTDKFKIGNGIDTWSQLAYFETTDGLAVHLADYIPLTQKAANNGVATLNSSGKVPSTQLDISSQLSTYYQKSGGEIAGNVTITGNLVVQGNTTTVSATNLEVTDPLIYLASQQYDTDTVDIGIYGAYGDVSAGHYHTGLIRDASDGGKWKLISGGAEPSGNVVDFTGVTYDGLKIGALDATSATIGNVSFTEISYLDGVTSSIQTQLDAKANNLVSVNNSVTTSYTLLASDQDKLVEVDSSNAVTITVPPSTFPVGATVSLLSINDGVVTVQGGSNVTVNSTPTLKLRTKWSSATLVHRSEGLWILMGDLATS